MRMGLEFHREYAFIDSVDFAYFSITRSYETVTFALKNCCKTL